MPNNEYKIGSQHKTEHKGPGIGGGPGTVSYTHLDVYKRQSASRSLKHWAEKARQKVKSLK